MYTSICDELLDSADRRELSDAGHVALAIHHLADVLNGLRCDLCHGSTAGPGVLEFLGMQLRDSVAPAVEHVAEAVSDISSGAEGHLADDPKEG
jgi:hypothetical protein